MNINPNQFLSIEELQDKYLSGNKQASSGTRTTDGLTFQDVLNNQSQTVTETADIKFSKHASSRLADRNIELSTEQMERLQEGTVKANEKGIKESLVIVDQLAFIVNIPNNTVITAMNQNDAEENVFTNIDGAVII